MKYLLVGLIICAITAVGLPPIGAFAYGYTPQDVAAISAVGCSTWAAAHNRAIAGGALGSVAPQDCAGAPPLGTGAPTLVPTAPQSVPSGRTVQYVDPHSTLGQAAALICGWWAIACQELQLPQTWVVYFTPSDANEKGFVLHSDPYTIHVTDEYAASPIATGMVIAHELTHVAQYTDGLPMPGCFNAELAAFQNQDAFMTFEGYHLAATTVWQEAEFDCANS
jgi:hypothetical protein